MSKAGDKTVLGFGDNRVRFIHAFHRSVLIEYSDREAADGLRAGIYGVSWSFLSYVLGTSLTQSNDIAGNGFEVLSSMAKHMRQESF